MLLAFPGELATRHGESVLGPVYTENKIFIFWFMFSLPQISDVAWSCLFILGVASQFW